jgi:catechol 2,3-dioxygenase-like lactoylglutathione lyase family enzyme
MPAAARPDHMVLLVSNPGVSLPYYRALLPLLGFQELKARYWRSPHDFIIQIAEAKPDTRSYERYGAGMNHLGFSVESPAAVEAVRTGMIAAGFPAPEIQDLDGVTALFMKDPDGVRFEVSFFPPEIDLNV